MMALGLALAALGITFWLGFEAALRLAEWASRVDPHEEGW